MEGGGTLGLKSHEVTQLDLDRLTIFDAFVFNSSLKSNVVIAKWASLKLYVKFIIFHLFVSTISL